MENITRQQITNCLYNDIRHDTQDAEWFIALVEDFLHLLDGNFFDGDKLENPIYIKSIIESNKENEYAKEVMHRKSPELYISAVFERIVAKVKDKRFAHGKIEKKIAIYSRQNGKIMVYGYEEIILSITENHIFRK